MSYQLRFTREGTVMILDTDTGQKWEMSPDEADRLAFLAARTPGKFKQLHFMEVDGYKVEMQLEEDERDLGLLLAELSACASAQAGMRPN